MSDFFDIIDKLRTTEMGAERIRRNLGVQTIDPVKRCRELILNARDSSSLTVERKGKNWYAVTPEVIITINAGSLTVITAHKIKKP